MSGDEIGDANRFEPKRGAYVSSSRPIAGLAEGPLHRSRATLRVRSLISITKVALELGFARIGFAPIEKLERGGQALRAWLAGGLAGEMAYLASQGPRDDPTQLLEGARTVIALALPYPLINL